MHTLSIVSFRMNLSDLAKYSMTRSISHDLSATAELLVTHPSLV